MRLIAHLRFDACRLSHLRQLPSFPNTVRQRLLAVNVLAQLHRGHGLHEVHVVRRADDHGVDVLPFLIEHLAEIPKAGGLGMPFERSRRTHVVDVAEGNDVFSGRSRHQV
mgnify:CR=1 FL=1